MNLSKSNITPGQIHIAGALILLMLLSTSGYFLYTSWASRQSGIETSELELSQVSLELANTHNERGQMVNQISNLESRVIEDAEWVKSKSLNELAAQLVLMAEEKELFVDQFEPATPVVVDGVRMQPIQIRFLAPYSSISEWLDTVHRLMPDIHVMSISITSPSHTAWNVNADIRINWHIPE